MTYPVAFAGISMWIISVWPTSMSWPVTLTIGVLWPTLNVAEDLFPLWFLSPS